jgi:hypothetical protein
MTSISQTGGREITIYYSWGKKKQQISLRGLTQQDLVISKNKIYPTS